MKKLNLGLGEYILRTVDGEYPCLNGLLGAITTDRSKTITYVFGEDNCRDKVLFWSAILKRDFLIEVVRAESNK